jgi:hypothetical protein
MRSDHAGLWKKMVNLTSSCEREERWDVLSVIAQLGEKSQFLVRSTYCTSSGARLKAILDYSPPGRINQQFMPSILKFPPRNSIRTISISVKRAAWESMCLQLLSRREKSAPSTWGMHSRHYCCRANSSNLWRFANHIALHMLFGRLRISI